MEIKARYVFNHHFSGAGKFVTKIIVAHIKPVLQSKY